MLESARGFVLVLGFILIVFTKLLWLLLALFYCLFFSSGSTVLRPACYLFLLILFAS